MFDSPLTSKTHGNIVDWDPPHAEPTKRPSPPFLDYLLTCLYSFKETPLPYQVCHTACWPGLILREPRPRTPWGFQQPRTRHALTHPCCCIQTYICSSCMGSSTCLCPPSFAVLLDSRMSTTWPRITPSRRRPSFRHSVWVHARS